MAPTLKRSAPFKKHKHRGAPKDMLRRSLEQGRNRPG